MRYRLVVILGLIGAIAALLVFKHRNPRVETKQAADIQTALPRLVDLGAGKCAACKMMMPILDDLKRDFGSTFSTEVIDVWEHPDVAEQYGIRMIPTQIFFDATGKELFRHEGFFSREDILGIWQKHGVTPGPRRSAGPTGHTIKPSAPAPPHAG